VNCTLTLLNAKIRVDNTASSKTDFANDAHFVTNYAATQSIATSTAQNDPGLFEVNFRDERYLPFEGAGAISSWQIDLPIDCNAFDFDSISDVVINLRYTSRSVLHTARSPSRPHLLRRTLGLHQAGRCR
jgi:Tc toxin complex TcA C-terminal TcB-binding domain